MSSATDPAQAILAMVNWLGLIVMPVMAALFLAIGVYKYSKGESMERCVIGVMVAISISGITRLAEYFVATSAGNSVVTDTYSNALLNLTNWVANVILPVYAAIEVVRAGISFEDLTTMRTDLRPVKHFATAVMCCAVSAIMRLDRVLGRQRPANWELIECLCKFHRYRATCTIRSISWASKSRT